MLDVRRLRLIRDLSRLGTIAAVAQAHTYSPSAVSQQLAVLEREAGVPLLERTGRRVRLTRAGAALVRHAETVLAALEETEAAVAALRTGLTGALRIGAYPTAVRTLLPGALVALGREHPGLDLMVSEIDPAAVPDALRERRLDVGLLHDYDIAPVAPDRALESVALLDETVFLAVAGAPDVDGARSRNTTRRSDVPGSSTVNSIDDARHQPWIIGSPGTLCHEVTLRLCRAAGYAPRIRHHADDFDAVLALVAAGQGVAIVPELAARPPAGVHLVPLATRRRTRVAYRRGAADHPAVAAAVTAVRRAARDFRR